MGSVSPALLILQFAQKKGGKVAYTKCIQMNMYSSELHTLHNDHKLYGKLVSVRTNQEYKTCYCLTFNNH